MPTVVKDDVGDVEANLDLHTVPDDVIKYAREKLHETPENKVRAIQELRDMVYERGDVTPIRMDDAYLLRFLRSRSFKVESAYRLLVNYGIFRENNAHFYENVNPLDLGFLGDADVVSVLPYREQNGRRIMIYKLGKWKPSDYHIDELFKASLAILELGMLEPRAQILGGVVIWDLAGLTLNHAWQITPTVASKVIELMVTSFPMKTAAIHIVNESRIFDMIFRVFKPLLGKRYREIMFFHGDDMESLHNHIDPKYLPEIYGGIRPHYCYKDWFRTLSRNPEIVREMKELGYIHEVYD
ncbi:alpha-tocopherol transfer protein-like isoform X1 [Nilaparvata lugens]|uniref:alpha-tocopherol transfer protein-like isoform X1 n=1 Tax=Nilaparvata lugens TaxID=108931 RepID=UPI000B980BDF|nr:alpha-tocopherol transfer protein-like isoform X1 [Nilaparvata lugens]XP_039278553.1 alpha-tocopherol transfer protein-like isoform X1 [Nilaparvata lugens]